MPGSVPLGPGQKHTKGGHSSLAHGFQTDGGTLHRSSNSPPDIQTAGDYQE